MADFVAVLKKTLDGLGETTPATRERVYEKARSTIAAKLAALSPQPPAGVADRQMRALEEAIAKIESEYAPVRFDDPLAELENVFASLKNPQPRMLDQPKGDIWPKTTPSARPPKPAEEPVVAQRAFEPDATDDVDMEDDDREVFPAQHAGEASGRRRGYGGVLAAALGLAIIAGGGYGLWLNKDAFIGSGAPETAATTPAEPAPATDAVAAAPAQPAAPADGVAPGEAAKFTQRLTPEGEENDPGPAGGQTGVGEGTSVAALNQPAEPGQTPLAGGATPETPADAAASPTATPAETPDSAAAATPDAAVPVGQKAIFYEERTSSAAGSAEPGTIVWSLIQESPGGNLPPEPAIRAEATIPGKDVQLRMTIKRNADQTLPASHIIEMIFLTPENFEGGGIENILRVAMKGSEQEAGNPLIGIPAKIAEGFFLVALNDTKAEIDANMGLLRRQSWIDVPVVYKSGRRALFTMEKGIPGDKVFDEALQAWQAASASAG